MSYSAQVGTRQRCAWATTDLSISYHDEEWGVPVHDDRRLFEFLILEGAQAGLSWETILRKRRAYQEAFAQFDAPTVASYDTTDLQRLISNAGIVRNRLKITSTIKNAQAFLRVQSEFGAFDTYIWNFVDGQPQQHTWQRPEEIPTSTPESLLLSKDLRRRGFTFVGPTICYAFMQATGMVNDHLIGCYRHAQISSLSESSGHI